MAAPQQHQNTTLPVPNPTKSYWRSEPHRLDSYRSTPELPETTDVVIIGAGLAGVSTAYHLSNAPNPPTITLLEARQTCSGATGRNGGHVKTKTATLIGLAEKHGAAAADDVARFVGAQMHALKGVVETERLDGCEFEPRRSYDVFLSEGDASAAAAAWRACVGRGDAWTRDVSLVGPDMAEGVTGVRGARAAFSVPCCSLWPYKFVTGLLEAAMRRNPGLSLHTETPVLGVGAVDGGSSLVVTDRGPVRAKKVVFATNAYTAGLLPRYRNVIMPYKGTCAHLAALGREEPVFPHLANTYNVDFGLEGKEGLETVDYLNPRPDGGIVVGGGKWVFEENRHLWYNTVDDSTQIGPIMKAKYFDGYMQRTFKGWENSGTETEQVWTGIMGSTPDGAPHVGAVPGAQNQWILAGFNGGGNSLVYLAAKGVATMIRDGVPFEESGAGIPKLFKTTEARLQTKAPTS